MNRVLMYRPWKARTLVVVAALGSFAGHAAGWLSRGGARALTAAFVGVALAWASTPPRCEWCDRPLHGHDRCDVEAFVCGGRKAAP